ncbi:MAG: hypothetical protein EAZ27_11170 [Cytophagales bacterium]|nr:MAG: hypothetical protein EAZ27_11170 [Cytophagales bacterium]
MWLGFAVRNIFFTLVAFVVLLPRTVSLVSTESMESYKTPFNCNFFLMGTPKNLNSDKALLLGLCGFVAEIGLGEVFEYNIGVFRSYLLLYRKF